jgi:hypothetical protein
MWWTENFSLKSRFKNVDVLDSDVQKLSSEDLVAGLEDHLSFQKERILKQDNVRMSCT